MSADKEAIPSDAARMDARTIRQLLERSAGRPLDDFERKQLSDIANRREAVAVPETEAVSIKPLEWRYYPDAFPPAWDAATPFGRYSIEEGMSDNTEDPALHSDAYEIWNVYFSSGLLSVRRSPEEAKSSAQADYETRIRAALIHPDLPDTREGFKPRKPFNWYMRLPYDNTEYADTDLGTYSVWEISGSAYFYAPQGFVAGKHCGMTIDDAKRAAERHLVDFAQSLIATGEREP